jgi:arylsulfatase B
MKTLDEEKLRENTLIIFISDNGAQENWLDVANQYEGKHGPYDRLGYNSPLRDWKTSLYEGGVRVPALFNWPVKLKPAKVNDVTSVNDIFPTLAYVSKSALPEKAEIAGINIWKTIANGTAVGERVLYWRTPGQFALRKGDWKLVFNGKNLDEGTSELFNLADDPDEKQNVASGNQGIVNIMFE